MNDETNSSPVGVFKASIKVTSMNDPAFKTAVNINAWVDSGATFTQIPASILVGLGVKPERQSDFVLADGRIIKRDIGVVRIKVEGISTVNEVSFGDDNCDPLLGSFSLETTGLLVDPLSQKLIKRPGGIIQFSEIQLTSYHPD